MAGTTVVGAEEAKIATVGADATTWTETSTQITTMAPVEAGVVEKITTKRTMANSSSIRRRRKTHVLEASVQP